jgi:hypothetical protein
MSMAPSFVDEFADVATIRDRRAFNARVAQVIQREIDRALKGERPSNAAPTSFRAPQRWMPTATELQRGRAQLLELFNAPHLLKVPHYAALAGKSRQQIYKDIAARRLLVLSIGAGGQRIPDWHLDPAKQRLTQRVLQRATDVDPWTLYHALSQNSKALAGKAPIDRVNMGNIERLLAVVLDQLGIHN